MSKIKLTTVPFSGTKEQEAKLRDALVEIKKLPGATMPALQKAQEIYGYLPIEVQTIVAEELGVSLEEVFGVSTFYAQFSLNPQGKYQIGVCMGTACYVKGSQQVIDKFAEIIGINPGQTSEDGLFTLDALRCIGACGIAPALTINGKVYPKVSVADVQKIVDEYKSLGGAN